MGDTTEKVRPGKYRHYKGGTYTVLFVAAHHETRAPQVVYVCHDTGNISVRPVRGTQDDPDGWLDEVTVNSSDPIVPRRRDQRFTYIGEVD